MNLKNKIILIASLLVLAILIGLRACHDRKQDKQIASPILQQNEKEKIIVDPRHHKITTITADKTKTQYLPDRPSAISLRNNEDVVIETRAWGTELEGFMGFSYGDTSRMDIGASVFYWHKLDLDVALAARLSNGPYSLVKPLVGVSYNVYSNTNLFVGINPFSFTGTDIHGGVFFRW